MANDDELVQGLESLNVEPIHADPLKNKTSRSVPWNSKATLLSNHLKLSSSNTIRPFSYSNAVKSGSAPSHTQKTSVKIDVGLLNSTPHQRPHRGDTQPHPSAAPQSLLAFPALGKESLDNARGSCTLATSTTIPPPPVKAIAVQDSTKHPAPPLIPRKLIPTTADIPALEIYDYPPSMDIKQIALLFKEFDLPGKNFLWYLLDFPSRALVVVEDAATVNKIIESTRSGFHKVRVASQSDYETVQSSTPHHSSTSFAAVSSPWLSRMSQIQPFVSKNNHQVPTDSTPSTRVRPKTTSVVAHRLIANALGLSPRKTEDMKRKEVELAQMKGIYTIA